MGVQNADSVLGSRPVGMLDWIRRDLGNLEWTSLASRMDFPYNLEWLAVDMDAFSDG